MSGIDQIKDTDQLQEFLNKQSKNAGVTKQTEVQNDYTGKMQAKKKAPSTAAVSDRYTKRSSVSRQNQNKHFETDIAVASKDDPEKTTEENLEMRSVIQEIDYTKKDAARNIVTDAKEKRKRHLRERVLKHINVLGKGGSGGKSDYGSSYKSVGLRSRYSNARKSDIATVRKDAQENGRLSKIDEDGPEPSISSKCTFCPNDEADIDLCGELALELQ